MDKVISRKDIMNNVNKHPFIVVHFADKSVMYDLNYDSERSKVNNVLKKNKGDTVGWKLFGLRAEAMNCETLYNNDSSFEIESSSSESDYKLESSSSDDSVNNTSKNKKVENGTKQNNIENNMKIDGKKRLQSK